MGMKAIGVFLVIAATVASLADVTLVHPGTPLDGMWKLNPRAYAQLAPLGAPVGIAFLFLGASLAVAAVGWFRRRYWGWLMAITIFTTQLLGDMFNFFRGDHVGGAVGVVFAAVVLLYIVHLRRCFPIGRNTNLT